MMQRSTEARGTGEMSVLVLSAGLSSPSSTRMLSDQLSAAVRTELEARGSGVRIETHELRGYAHEITDAMLTGFPGERLAALIASMREADAIIAVTPIFNTGPAGLFKSFVDVVPLEVWAGRPVLLGATAGSARHALALEYAIRPMFVYLKAALVPTAVLAASADFGAPSTTEAEVLPLAARARRAAQELVALGCGKGRIGHEVAEQPSEPDGPADERPGADRTSVPTTGETAPGGTAGRPLDAEFSDFVPMDTLLRGR